ncbi:MAG: regulatory protein GemA [Proteobacteria bacterium]|nr:regulatory protein GemA [Pseudomonadota bacterium]
MNSNRRADLARIHMGKKQLGMDDIGYRDMLFRLFDKDSSAKLNAKERWRLILRLEELGASFTHKGATSVSKPKNDFYEIPDGTSHARQKRYVAALWKSLGYKMSGLDVRAKKQFGVDKFLWLDDEAAVGTMARDLYSRAKKRGLSPDSW